MLKSLIYSLRFMTILPIPWKENEDLAKVSRSSGQFPTVGLIIGLLLYLSYILLHPFFSSLTLAFIQMLIWVFLTGGLHLDGLSDTFDGLGSRQTREKTLEIMKDSRMGAFGTLSLIVALLAKVFLINELNLISPSLIIIPPILGRWSQLIGIYFFKSARTEGMGKFFKDYIRKRELLWGAFTSVLFLIIVGGVYSLIMFLAISIFSYIESLRISKKLGGLTGDVYGLLCETSEIFSLLIFPIYLSSFPIHSLFF